MKLYNAVVPRLNQKYGITLDQTFEQAISKISNAEDREIYLEALKYPNGNWRKKNAHIRVVK